MSHRILMGIIMTLSTAGSTHAQVTGPTPFGKTADGTPVESYTLKNKNGMTVKLMTLGATVTEINVPDKAGKFANVVLGFDDVAGYQSDRNQYFGCTVGRVANRIANGKFTIEGKEYKVAVNNGPHHLHGGVKKSFDKVVWKAERIKNPDLPGLPEGVVFSYTSEDGEEGYPGTLKVTVTHSLNDKNELHIDYHATTTKATPIGLTNHSYFNLGGAGSATVLDHELKIEASEYVPVDKTLIPTGKLDPVAGTVFDFTKMTRIGERIEKLYDTGAMGYDHCFGLTKREKSPTLAAKLRDPKSGRALTVLTTQPGVQVYTGNFLKGQKGAGGKEYRQRSAVCLETGDFPDAINQTAFPPILLRPGRTYEHSCVYAFSAE